jgi:flagellar basal body P-ring formation protein FlgA
MKFKHLLLTLLAAVALCRPSLAASIGIPSHAIVDKATISLVDLHAAIKASPEETNRLDTVVVALAPAPGQNAVLTRTEIVSRLSQAGFTAESLKFTCPETVQITRRALVIKGADIVTAAADFIRAQVPVTQGDELTVNAASTPADIVAAYGKLNLSCESLGQVSGRNLVSVAVTVSVDNETIRRSVIQLRISLVGDVLVASHALVRNAILQDADVKLVRKDLLGMRGAPLRAVGDITGKRTTLALAAECMLTDANIEPAPLIKKGQEVTITVWAAGVVVTVPGNALEDGAPGAIIRVRTNFNKDDFTAKVVGEGNVAIVLSTPGRPI